jgi:hypothetical protein
MDPTQAAAIPPAPPPSHALRVTFAYRDDDIRLAGSERVEMIAPPVVTALPRDGHTGYWVQMSDGAGRVLWHRPLASPIAIDVEAFSPERRQSITRVPLARVEGRFSVIVPDLPDASDLSLHGPPQARHPDAPAGELLRLPVDSLRKSRPPATGGTDRPGGR